MNKLPFWLRPNRWMPTACLVSLCFGGHVPGQDSKVGTNRIVRARERPFMQADAREKERLLGLIGKYPWAANCFEEMKRAMAPLLENHKKSPSQSLEAVPAFPAGVFEHSKVLSYAEQAGVLYFMTGNEDYAQLAADILNVYVQKLGCDGQLPLASTDGRVRDLRDIYGPLGRTYDFVQPFLIREGATVFDKASQTRIPFDRAKAQLMFGKMVEEGFSVWIEGSNLTLPVGAGILACVLSIEDTEKRDAYVQTFLKGSKPLTGLYWIKQTLIDNRGIWPESSSYSHHTEPRAFELIGLVDRAYPDLHLFDGMQETLNGPIDMRFYVYPNGSEMAGFGDSKRRSMGARIPESFARLARRAGSGEAVTRILCQMKADREKFGYAPQGADFLNMDALECYEAKEQKTQALVLPYAGIVIQNNLHCADKKENGMMYYTGGAEYVHSHCSGLDLELYGAGCVMSGVGGFYEPRSAAIFNDYYRDYAGHNTVVVNGASKGAGKGFWGKQSMFYMDRTRMEAMEPASYTPAVSKEFAFSSQRLDDTVNNCTQQRIVSIVRTSDTSGYYLDLFRSRSNDQDKCHDYIYHNIGDRFSLRQSGGAELPLSEAPNRYPSYPVTLYRVNQTEDATTFSYTSPTDNEGKSLQSLTRRFPGWHYFTEVKTSSATAECLSGAFFMDALKRTMHVAMPGGFKREYTACKAPPILGAVKPYAAIASEGSEEKFRAQVLSIRQTGEAWDRPFVVAYEASASDKPTVQSIENIIDAGRVVGAKVVSKVDGRVITDIILAQDKAGAHYENKDAGISFTGRYAIVRAIKGDSGNKLVLYIGDGEKVSFQGNELSVGERRNGYKSVRL